MILVYGCLEEKDNDDLTKGYIVKEQFNPYKATQRHWEKPGFICPNTTSIQVEGYYGSVGNFSYAKIMINRCQESDLADAPDGEVDPDGRPLNKCFES